MSLIDLRNSGGSGATDLLLVESGFRVEYFTLTSTDIANGYLDLSRTPTTGNKVLLSVIDGLGAYHYGIDYNVLGSRLTWLAPLIPIFANGDTIRAVYYTDNPSGGIPAFDNMYSLVFNGTNEYVSILSDPTLYPNGGFAVSMWVKSAVLAGTKYIASHYRLAGERSWALRINGAAGTIGAILSQDGTATSSYNSTGSITFGTWNHVLVSYDGSNLYFYINGALANTVPVTQTSLFASTAPIVIGGLGDFASGAVALYPGMVDESAQFNRHVSPAEVAEIYNLSAPNNLLDNTTAASCMGWWRMGDTLSGTTMLDAAGSNDATIINMTDSNRSTDVP